MPLDTLQRDMARLSELSQNTLDNICDSINGMHIDRDEALSNIYEHLQDGDMVLIAGTRGSGKSAIVKTFLSSCSNNYSLAIRAEQLDGASLLHILTNAGITSNLIDLSRYFALSDYKVLVIESLEKVLEFSDTSAFIDVLSTGMV